VPRDVGLAQRLRAGGLTVKEVSGWKQRGYDGFAPRGFVRHHTAGPSQEAASSRTPSLNIIVNGRPDLSGPLCNLYLGYDRVVYVVASGVANHAGLPDRGSYRGMTGNSSAWGLEIEHPGTLPLPNDMHELSARACAATIRGTCKADMVCDHKEWAPSRKIDLATAPSPAQFRDRVSYYLKGGTVANEASVPAWFWPWLSWYLTTDRDPKKKPKSAPPSIPRWAWDMQTQVLQISQRFGMTDSERKWIDWRAKGSPAASRPKGVPASIPPRWWPDNEWAGKRK
jgi:hypothetical protein